MKKLEEYTGEKVYAFPNGAKATKEAVLERFPAAEDFTFVVTTDEYGEVMFGMDNLSALRSIYNIDKSLSKDDAIATIEEIMNTPTEAVEAVSAEERIAAALEAQVMMSMPDVEDETTDGTSEADVISESEVME